MAKDPAFLFYSADFATGTQFLTDEQVGKYIRLLVAQHQHGHLEEKQMLFICKSYDKDIFSKFIKDANGLYFNKRLELESIKRKEYAESRSLNKAGKTKGNIIIKSYDNHMDNENKDSINNTVNDHLIYGFDRMKLEFSRSATIIEDYKILYPVNEKRINELFTKFLLEQRAKNKLNRTFGELKDHFGSWIKLEIEKHLKKDTALTQYSAAGHQTQPMSR